MHVLSDYEIKNYLDQLKDTLINYDFSSVSNLLFYNTDSFHQYIMTVKDNPFINQYYEIEKLLNQLSPYIDIDIPNEILELLNDLDYCINASDCTLLENMKLSLILDFLDRVKMSRTKNDWEQLVSECINNKYKYLS